MISRQAVPTVAGIATPEILDDEIYLHATMNREAIKCGPPAFGSSPTDAVNGDSSQHLKLDPYAAEFMASSHEVDGHLLDDASNEGLNLSDNITRASGATKDGSTVLHPSIPPFIPSSAKTNRLEAGIKLLNSAKLFKFRTVKCLKKFNHVWKDCDFSHARNLRRDPSQVLYCPELCCHFSYDQELLSQCSKGTHCQFCHSKEEMNFHPLRYKTIQCRTRLTHENCPREFCAYWHSAEDKSNVTPEIERFILIMFEFTKPESVFFLDDGSLNATFINTVPNPALLKEFINNPENETVQDWVLAVYNRKCDDVPRNHASGPWLKDNLVHLAEFFEIRYASLMRAVYSQCSVILSTPTGDTWEDEMTELFEARPGAELVSNCDKGLPSAPAVNPSMLEGGVNRVQTPGMKMPTQQHRTGSVCNLQRFPGVAPIADGPFDELSLTARPPPIMSTGLLMDDRYDLDSFHNCENHMLKVPNGRRCSILSGAPLPEDSQWNHSPRGDPLSNRSSFNGVTSLRHDSSRKSSICSYPANLLFPPLNDVSRRSSLQTNYDYDYSAHPAPFSHLDTGGVAHPAPFSHLDTVQGGIVPEIPPNNAYLVSTQQPQMSRFNHQIIMSNTDSQMIRRSSMMAQQNMASSQQVLHQHQGMLDPEMRNFPYQNNQNQPDGCLLSQPVHIANRLFMPSSSARSNNNNNNNNFRIDNRPLSYPQPTMYSMNYTGVPWQSDVANE
eukprot:GHVH01016010.1.p1 GENE.GHVH01016010.1~~GHVH01016010.1.p1  ORF type:complete len:726 (+),score=76.63 GHVH01016010.1:406-2583(+)